MTSLKKLGNLTPRRKDAKNFKLLINFDYEKTLTLFKVNSKNLCDLAALREVWAFFSRAIHVRPRQSLIVTTQPGAAIWGYKKSGQKGWPDKAISKASSTL